MTTEKADLVFASLPYRIMHEFQIPIYDKVREQDADYYARLRIFEDDAGVEGGMTAPMARKQSHFARLDTERGPSAPTRRSPATCSSVSRSISRRTRCSRCPGRPWVSCRGSGWT